METRETDSEFWKTVTLASRSVKKLSALPYEPLGDAVKPPPLA
jgi:hypothetical protein